MKKFRRRIIGYSLPIVLAVVVLVMAVRDSINAQGGFKLGVDLAGGANLIYEVDTSKWPDGKKPETYSVDALAAALKRRIDPADLYNVTIRPVGEYRIEIILPTGGSHAVEVEQNLWKDLIAQVVAKWPPREYKVEGDIIRLDVMGTLSAIGLRDGREAR